MILKQVIHYPDTNSVEATWVERITLPQQEISEGIADLVMRTQEVTVKCHSYSDRQMDMLRADLGADASAHADLIAEVEANMQPIPPKTPEELAAEAHQIADAEAKAEAKADPVIQYLRDHTPAECEAYVQAKVTDLDSAKQLMKKFAVVLCVLTKQSLR